MNYKVLFVWQLTILVNICKYIFKFSVSVIFHSSHTKFNFFCPLSAEVCQSYSTDSDRDQLLKIVIFDGTYFNIYRETALWSCLKGPCHVLCCFPLLHAFEEFWCWDFYLSSDKLILCAGKPFVVRNYNLTSLIQPNKDGDTVISLS